MKLIILILTILIVAGTIGLAFVNAKSEAYDKKTLADVIRIQESLKVYFDTNGYYPLSDQGTPLEISQYLSFYPTNDNCPYTYERKFSDSYTIRYCLESGEVRETGKEGI